MDVGHVLNPQAARGQVMGGANMGLSFASRETFQYNDEGVVLNTVQLEYIAVLASKAVGGQRVMVANTREHSAESPSNKRHVYDHLACLNALFSQDTFAKLPRQDSEAAITYIILGMGV